MRRLIFASALALATLPLASLSGSAAPMSTSDLLKPKSDVTQAWCKRYCHHYGRCGYGYHKHRCCKVWKKKCY